MSARHRQPWWQVAAALALIAATSANSVAAAPQGDVPVPAASSEAPRPAEFVLAGESTQGGWLKGTAPAGATGITLDGQAIPLAPDGRFFLAFDRDAPASALLAAKLADGSTIQRSLAITPRAWKIEHVDVAKRPSMPTEAFLALRKPELERIAAARTLDSGSAGWQQHFTWPVLGRVSGSFGSQRIYRGEPGSYHSGIDISTGTSGTPFVAPADGVVILAAQSPFTLEGHLLMIDHGIELNSAFLHCSELLVKEGDTVKQGQVIGRIGMSGRATGPHLHWSLKWHDARLDPILFTGPMP